MYVSLLMKFIERICMIHLPCTVFERIDHNHCKVMFLLRATRHMLTPKTRPWITTFIPNVFYKPYA